MAEGEAHQPHASATGPGSSPDGIIALEADLPGLPCDQRNLVVRIADAWAREVGLGFVSGNSAQGTQGDPTRGDVAPVRPTPPGRAPSDTPGSEPQATTRISARPVDNARTAQIVPVRARLHKRIPVGGGLGGGSSDAAHALLALDRLWDTGASAEVLSAFAARFGSDLSFFFFAPSAVCLGRGEIVRPVPRPAVRWAVLLLPGTEMPTAAVYRRFDELGLGGEAGAFGRDGEVAAEPDWREWAALGAVPLLRRLANDLERPAFDLDPALGRLRSSMESQLGRPVRMSGSGSSLFTLFDTREEADAAAGRAKRSHGVRALAVELGPEVRLP